MTCSLQCQALALRCLEAKFLWPWPRDQWSWLEGPGLSLGPGLEGWGFGLGPKFLASLQITSSIPNILWICTINLIFLTSNKTLWYTRSKTKEHIALSEIHLKTMGRHLWMGSQCYLPPDRHNQTGWYLIYRPCKDERLSWPSWLVLYRDGLPSHRCDAFLPNEAYVADSKVEQQAFICVKGVVW